MSAREELALVLANAQRVRNGSSTLPSADQCSRLAFDDADAILAAGYVKAAPVWEESLVNDGVYEYTTTGSCDGKESWHWKRKPRLSYDSGQFPWQENATPKES